MPQACSAVAKLTPEVIAAISKAESASATVFPVGSSKPVKLALSVKGLSDALAALQPTPAPPTASGGAGAARHAGGAENHEIGPIAAPDLFGFAVRLVDQHPGGGSHRIELLAASQLELWPVFRPPFGVVLRRKMPCVAAAVQLQHVEPAIGRVANEVDTL